MVADPQALAEADAVAIPRARPVTDEPGKSPLAWLATQLSRVIGAVAAEAAES